MIIDAQSSKIEVIGDIQEFKTGIDPKNLEFITTLLSSNLYSDPEGSFIREIVSNAWDSHVEAKTTDTPVLIKFDKANSSITIRDFGTGLSPERFKEVYCNIGSSTKRESNDFIGGFGIGKYSSLACSNTVYITSYFEGKEYRYIMVKNGNSITTNLVCTLNTKEKNGVEVTIRNIGYFRPFERALNQVTFFPNVYIDGLGLTINDFQIKKFNNYACASKSVENKLLLGNVLYPCDISKLSDSSKSFIRKIQNTGIVIKFEVGELNITPNRESIIYTKDTIKIIDSRIEATKNELYTNIEKVLQLDYNDIFEYYDVVNSSHRYNPITHKISDFTDYIYSDFQFRITDLNSAVSYNNQDIHHYLSHIGSIQGSYLPHLRGVVCADKIYTNKYPYRAEAKAICSNDKILVIGNCNRLTSVIKSYLKENYDGYAIITDFTLDDFKLHLKDIKIADPFILKECYNTIKKRCKYIDFTTSKDFLDYKEDIEKSKEKIPVISNIKLYVYSGTRGYTIKNTLEFKNLNEAIDNLKRRTCGIVIDYISSDATFFASIANARGYLYITANKEVVKALENVELTQKVSKNFILNTDKTLSKVKTILKYSNVLNAPSDVLCSIPKDIRSAVLELRNYIHQYNKFPAYIRYATTVDVPLDSYIEYIGKKLRMYVNSWNYIKDDYSLCDSYNLDTLLIQYLILKNKLFRINYCTFLEVKNNKLIQTLCKK